MIKLTVIGLQLSFGIILLSIYGCINTGTIDTNQDLLSGYRSKILSEAKKEFGSTVIIEDMKIDSSADMETFRQYWLSRIKELKTSDSLDFIFYYGIVKSGYERHSKMNQFPDSIELYKSDLNFLKIKIDSSIHGQFGNPAIKQFERLSNEKSKIYFIQTKVKSKNDSEPLTLYFGIEELEKDTMINWTTNPSLFHFVTEAYLRRNADYWTKGLEKE